MYAFRLSTKWLNRAELKKFSRTIRRAMACSCRKHSNKLQFEKWLEHRVQAVFGTFCLLLGGVNCAQAQETRDSKFGDFKEQQIWKKQFGELFRSE